MLKRARSLTADVVGDIGGVVVSDNAARMLGIAFMIGCLCLSIGLSNIDLDIIIKDASMVQVEGDE